MRQASAIALLCMALAVLGGTPVAAQPAAVKDGRSLAQRLCARCHSIAASGESPMRSAPPFRTLPQRYPVEHLAEALAEGIVTGHPAMPQFEFSPAEIDALLGFIDGLSPPDAAGRAKRK
jgi:mono/diheme cytochrome c family protein